MQPKSSTILAVGLALKAISRREVTVGARSIGWPWVCIVGAIGGVLSGLFGVGGATIVPPASFFEISQTAAQGLALATIVPGTFVALLVYAKSGAVDWYMGIPMAIGGLIALPAGVAAAHKLD